jgi:hypothetical protein
VSKKTRPRRSGPSGTSTARPSGTSTARPSGTSTARPSGTSTAGSARAAAGDTLGRSEADAIVQRVLSSLWGAIAAGDPLRAELETSTCMAIPHVAGQRNPAETESFVSSVLVNEAIRRQTPEGAAMLRTLMSLGTPAIRKAASRALGELTGSGIYPPEWVTEIGKVTPGQAWRRYDIFGDDETVAATFSYGETEHAVVMQVDLTGVPIATAIGVASNAASLIEAINRIGDDEFDRAEQIDLTEARRRMEEPLARCEEESDTGLTADTVAYLPVARTRIRRLPVEAFYVPPDVTAADRAAAVDDFMKSPLAADAVSADEESTRFWAEVLTGYSSRISGEPPTRVGPRTLVHILLGHVVTGFTLSPAQRRHREPAVTAWVRWSAEQRNLDEAQTTHLIERLPAAFSRFDEAYDDPGSATIRGYASDLAASDVDVSWLTRNVGRRMFALPIPPPGDERRDVSDPAGRRALVEAEFGTCTPPAGMTSEQFVDAACGVVEELWRTDDLNVTYQAASGMMLDGVPRHDIIHRLAGEPSPTVGASMTP